VDWSAITYVNVSDSGAGTETVAQARLVDTVTDSGVGTDEVAMQAQIPASDSGSGSDAVTPTANVSSAETGGGAETVSAYVPLTVTDAGAGSEYATRTWTIVFHETGIGVEFAWRIKGSTLIDSTALPHVLSIQVTDEAQMSGKKIQGGALPLRTLVGKPGRVVEIQGWSDSQSELDAMDALADGTTRTFIHPSGDSFAVLITAFDYDRAADKYTRRDYRLTLKETR